MIENRSLAGLGWHSGGHRPRSDHRVYRARVRAVRPDRRPPHAVRRHRCEAVSLSSHYTYTLHMRVFKSAQERRESLQRCNRGVGCNGNPGWDHENADSTLIVAHCEHACFIRAVAARIILLNIYISIMCNTQLSNIIS